MRRLSARAEEDQDANDWDAAQRQTASLAGLAAVLLLVVLALGLVRVLAASGAVQDCLMAGRRDCDAVLAGLPSSP